MNEEESANQDYPTLSDRRTVAAAWRVRLSSDDATETDFEAFEGWVVDPANRAAFAALDDLDAAVGENADVFRLALEASEAPQANVVRPIFRRAWVSGALAAAAVIAIAILVLPKSEPTRWIVYAAPSDRAQVVKLEDGSSVVLNRGAAMRVAFAHKSRQVELSAGEASFDIAHDTSRPFSVLAGEDRLEDIGTEFNVLATGQRTVVTVREGMVGISPRSGGASGVVNLGAGDQFVHVRGETPVITTQVNADAAFSWHDGHLIYNDATLAQVVDDLNRYFDRNVRIEDADTAAIRFSGVVVIDNEDVVLARLKGLLPIDVQASGKEVVVRRKGKR